MYTEIKNNQYQDQITYYFTSNLFMLAQSEALIITASLSASRLNIKRLVVVKRPFWENHIVYQLLFALHDKKAT
jgi:hypothetical protein